MGNLSLIIYKLFAYFFNPSVYIGEGNGKPLQYSCLENPMDGGAWQGAVHGLVKSQTLLSGFTFTFHFHALEKEMASHSSVRAWRIPGTGELVGCHLWGRTESDTTEATQQQQQQCVYKVVSQLLNHTLVKSKFTNSVYALVFLYSVLTYFDITLSSVIQLCSFSLVSALVRLHHTFVIQIASSAALYTSSWTSPISLVIYFQRSIH